MEVIGDGRHAALTSEEPHPWGTVVEVRSPHAAGVRGAGTLGAGHILGGAAHLEGVTEGKATGG